MQQTPGGDAMTDSISVADFIALPEITEGQATAAARMVHRLCPHDADVILAALGIGGAA